MLPRAEFQTVARDSVERKKGDRKIGREREGENVNPFERNYDEYRSLFSSTMPVVMSPLLLRSREACIGDETTYAIGRT